MEIARTVAIGLGLCLVIAGAGHPAAAQPEPPYVARGHQVEARRQELAARLARLHDRLAETLGLTTPDLLARLVPPPPTRAGYQILPRIIPDTPPAPPAKPQVVSYSWSWSETLIGRVLADVDRLDAAVAALPRPPAAADRASYEALVADYRKAINQRGPIDSDVDYNWLWQRRVAANRPLFDRLTAELDAAAARIEHQEVGDSPSLKDDAPLFTSFDPPSFVHVTHPTDHEWLVTVPLVTDIEDAALVARVASSIETYWHAGTGADDFRVRLEVETISPFLLYCRDAATSSGACTAPPRGASIDLTTHAALFPSGRAVLTTGAAALQIVANRALVLSAHDVNPRTLAHEFGHLLGLPDAYLRGYRDRGADGFAILELVPDTGDIMASPGNGVVRVRHLESVVAAVEIQADMTDGVDALYVRRDPAAAIARFRQVLARNPNHLGATLQLAKALDANRQPDDARVVWVRVLAMAEAVGNTETTETAQARLALDR